MKRVIVAGLLGGLVLIIWTLIVNGLLGFKARIDMNEIPAERQVYELLKENITEPGRYVCNPEVTEAGQFPADQPVFSVLYGGVGHEAAGSLALMQLPIFLAAPLIAAWLLSRASSRILVSYPRKVLFVVAIGLLLAVSGPLGEFGIASYPLSNALVLSLHEIALWTAIGLVVAWKVRPPASTEG